MNDRDNPWTFEGARYAQLRDSVLKTTPTDRIRWLEQALAIAESSGALARQRARERRYWEQLWNKKENKDK